MSPQSSEPNTGYETKLQKKRRVKYDKHNHQTKPEMNLNKIQTHLFFFLWHMNCRQHGHITDHLPLQVRTASLTTLSSPTNSHRNKRQRRRDLGFWKQRPQHKRCCQKHHREPPLLKTQPQNHLTSANWLPQLGFGGDATMMMIDRTTANKRLHSEDKIWIEGGVRRWVRVWLF